MRLNTVECSRVLTTVGVDTVSRLCRVRAASVSMHHRTAHVGIQSYSVHAKTGTGHSTQYSSSTEHSSRCRSSTRQQLYSTTTVYTRQQSLPCDRRRGSTAHLLFQGAAAVIWDCAAACELLHYLAAVSGVPSATHQGLQNNRQTLVVCSSGHRGRDVVAPSPTVG
jgi:hypothetical protein